MIILEKLTEDFKSLLSKTDVKSFTEAKLQFYETIFYNFADEENLYRVLTAFEMACTDYIKTNFSEKVRNTIKDDFQMIVITLRAS